jgi:hypothetical protein
MKRRRMSPLSLMRQGACGVVCSAGRSPSRSQRRIVWVHTPSWRAASWIETPSSLVRARRGPAGMSARSRIPATRAAVNGRPLAVRWPCLARIIAISASELCSASRRISATRFLGVSVRLAAVRLSATASSVWTPPCQKSSTRAWCRTRSTQITTSSRPSRHACGDCRPQGAARCHKASSRTPTFITCSARARVALPRRLPAAGVTSV